MFQHINSILWAVATSFIIVTSVYLTFYLRFPQFNLKKILFSFHSKEKKGLSNFSVFMMSLAGKIGIGSIAGIALAIYIGGPGSIFWIWIMTILSAVLCYSETILGTLYKEKDGDLYKGGPSYYIKKGLCYPKLGGLYAILIIISYIGGFISIQTNTITVSIREIFSLSPSIIGVILVILSFTMILNGIKEIAKVSSKIVPVMMFIYLLSGLFILFKNMNQIPEIMKLILSSAFSFKPFITGFLTTFIVGIQRGVFATEAGLGTSSIAASVSNNDSSLSLANMQVLGVYLTSFIICTITAFIVLSSNYIDLDFSSLNGIEIIESSFLYHIPKYGHYIVVISIFFFAFSTILTGYYYGESSYKYLDKNTNNIKLFLLKVITMVIVYIGCITSPTLLWNVVDILVALLTIINTFSILKLKKDILEVTIVENHKK